MRRNSIFGSRGRRLSRLVCALAAAVGMTTLLDAKASPEIVVATVPPSLTRDEAVRYALQHNPALMTVRLQHGYGEAACVLAHTYPFNPVYTGYVAQASGPASSSITNQVYLEQYVTLELELRGQGKHRRAGAAAMMSRIEAEIAQQELVVSIAVVRACNAVLYRQQKLAIVEETIKINEAAVKQIGRQVNTGKSKPTDLVLARADLDSLKAQSFQARSALAAARSDLRRLLGTSDDTFTVVGDQVVPVPSTDQGALTELALRQRPDLSARHAAVCETEAALRLIVANRYGNPSVGPFFEYDPTRTAYAGGRLSMPLPVLNTKKGEIMKAETDLARVQSDVRQLELVASQDVQAALARLTEATKWAAGFEKDVVPSLLTTKKDAERLYAAKDASVDLGRLLTVQRGYLKAADALLDARFEVSQAVADLALAAAEPMLALGPKPGEAGPSTPAVKTK